VPLLAHPDGARARAPPAAPPRAHPRAQPHVHRGRVPHGGRRGRADRDRVDVDRPAVGRLEDPPPLRRVRPGRARGVEPPRPGPALPRGGDGRPVPADADDARLRPHGGRRDEAAPRSVHRGDARCRARAVPRRGAPARAPRGRVRQLSDRRLSPHGRRHRAGRDDRARHDGGDRRRGGDPPPPRAHRDPGLRRRRPRAGAIRRVPPRVLRPLRGGLRPLRGLHPGDRRARAGRRGRLPRALRLRPSHVGRLPRPLRRRAARAPAAPE